jgi:RNA polymerase sigma-70 factor (ECF subfamily)
MVRAGPAPTAGCGFRPRRAAISVAARNDAALPGVFGPEMNGSRSAAFASMEGWWRDAPRTRMRSPRDPISSRLVRRANGASFEALRVHEQDAGEVFELVEAARDGDRLAFGVLYDRFHPAVYRLAVARLCSTEDAEDAVADTFLRAWRGLDRFEWTGAPFLSWLLAIAHTQVLTLRRSRARKPATAMAEVPELAERGAAPHAQEQAIARMEAQRMLESLPEDQRIVLTLRFYGGLSAEEIGERIGKPAGSVRQIQMRALERLARANRKEAAA